MSAMIERDFVVPPYGELRIATPSVMPGSSPLTVRLLGVGAQDTPGTGPRAEIWGWSLEPDVAIEIGPGRRVAVLTHTGATLRVEGHPDAMREVYASAVFQGHPRTVVEIHHYLQSRRIAALKAPCSDDGPVPQGPRVLVCGTDSGSGKSTIVRALANYAVAQGYQPMLWDLDINAPSNVGFPCCLNLAALQHPIDTDDGVMVPGQHVFFGFSGSPDQNNAFFMHCVSRLWQTTKNRLERQEPAGCSGLIVDYPTLDADAVRASDNDSGHKEAGALATLLHTIDECQIDTVIVVGSDWLRHQLRCASMARASDESANDKWRRLGVNVTSMVRAGGASVRVISVEASDAAVPMTAAERNLARIRRWREYFYGVPSTPLAPTIIDVPLETVKFVQMGTVATSRMQQLLPMGDDMINDAASIAYVNHADVDLNNRVAAVSNVSFFEFGEPEEPWMPRPVTERNLFVCEEELKDCIVVAFVTIVGMTTTHVKLLSSVAELPLGPTLLITSSSMPVN